MPKNDPSGPHLASIKLLVHKQFEEAFMEGLYRISPCDG